jgi:hypothetical protein
MADAPLPTDRSIAQILDSVNSLPESLPRVASLGRFTGPPREVASPGLLPGLARMGHKALKGLR